MLRRFTESQEQRYEQVVQLLLDREQGANNGSLGRVKLMKLLYYVDFNHYEKFGQSITGDIYVKREFGPVPLNAQMILNRLKANGLLTEEVGWYGNYQGAVYAPHWETPLQITILEPHEIDTIREVIQQFERHSAAAIVLASHGDPPWTMVDYGEPIPYEFVHYRVESTPRSDDDEDFPSGLD